MPELEQLVGSGAAIGVGLGGIWLIVRFIVHFQRDFTGHYRAEIKEGRAEQSRLERELELADDEIASLEVQLRRCRFERARAFDMLANQGISWNPIDWGQNDE